MNLKHVMLIVGSLLLLGGCGGGSSDSAPPTEPPPTEPPTEPPPTEPPTEPPPTEPPTEPPESSRPELSADVPFNDQGGVDWQDVSVHDPSIIEVDGTYYIFGSHLAAAKSEDLVHWSLVSSLSKNELVDESPLFDYSYTSEIAEGIQWTDGYTGNWAADVVIAPNGKYWFYYNHCAQEEADGGNCWNRSYLGLAESDSVEGPYEDKGVFLRSGYRDAAEFVDYPLDNGQESWDGAVDPNVIDPTAYYDAEGNLWLVYGSYSGGIFALAMDETTGMPEPGQGYGTHLLGGDFRAIEGAFVMYSPESEYFYLFYSVAGFALNDGYNIRIARSENPQGPYLDPAGNDIAGIGGTLEIGGKLMGGFEFTQELGETGEAWGYQSPGHNSAHYDEETGRHFLITHTRFPQTSTPYPNISEFHAVRVHEMFVNDDGWLVASPQRYVPLEGDNVVGADSIPGYYKFVNHGIESNTSAIRSTYLALHEDNTVSGAEAGSWVAESGDNIRLELDSGVYSGVLKWQWDPQQQALVSVFSALSVEGATVWGSRIAAISDSGEMLANVEQELQVKTELTVDDEGYSLPTVGQAGASISWESSDEYYIGNDGSVFIPTPDRGDQSVLLLATIELNGQSTTKEFAVDLQARPEFRNAVAHYNFNDSMNDTMGNYAAALTTDAHPANVNATEETYSAGYAGQAYQFTGANGVRLPDDLIHSDRYTVSFWVNMADGTEHTPAFFAALSEVTWISYIPYQAEFTSAGLLWSNYLNEDGEAEWIDIQQAAATPLNEWQHVAITYGNGTIQLYIDGSLMGSAPRPDLFSAAGGQFTLGVNYWDTPFEGLIDELIVYDYALGMADVRGAAMNNLTDASEFAGYVRSALDLGDLSTVRSSFELPRVGAFVSGIRWESDNEKFLKPVNGTAVVTQPTELEGEQTVTLTATITYQNVVETKTFEVSVKSVGPAEYSFEGDLNEFAGAYDAGRATGNRIDNTGGTVSYVDGVRGLAVDLNGKSGIRLPNNLITSNNYSVSLWLKPTEFTDFTTAFFAGASREAWISLVPSMGGVNHTRLWANMNGYFDNGGLSYRIPENEWTHLVIVAEGDASGTFRFYVNGELEVEATGLPEAFTVADEANEFALGVNYWDPPFNGAIDELKIFSEAITSERVETLYQEGSVD